MPVEWFTCSHVFKGAGTWLFSLELFFISFSKIIFSIFLWQRYSEMLFGWMEYLPWSVMRAWSQLWQIWCIHFALHRFSLLVLFLWFLCDDKHFFVWRKHCAPVKSHCRTITVSHSVILSPYPLPMCLEVSTYVVPVPPSWQNFFPPHEHNFSHVDYQSEMLRIYSKIIEAIPIPRVFVKCKSLTHWFNCKIVTICNIFWCAYVVVVALCMYVFTHCTMYNAHCTGAVWILHHIRSSLGVTSDRGDLCVCTLPQLFFKALPDIL